MGVEPMQEQRLQRGGTNTTAGLYILEFPPPPGGNQRVWRWGRKSQMETREKKEIWGKYNF